ncbi:MAG: hypothetical protein PVJ07_05615 [Anaerolineales bacterium]|jgi:succinate dehydrogenase / fumarate reductase cytochrome b subunit
MSSIKTTLEGSVRYRGAEGQLGFLLHRISGLGTILFLTIHILDTSLVYFFPSLYNHAMAIYRSVPFMLGEIVLVFMVLFHGANGVRIALFDLFPHWWKETRQKRSIYWVLGLAVLLWLPAAYLMGRKLIQHTILGG